MSPANQLLLTVALVVGIALGGITIYNSVAVKCIDFWPFKGGACAVTTR